MLSTQVSRGINVCPNQIGFLFMLGLHDCAAEPWRGWWGGVDEKEATQRGGDQKEAGCRVLV